MPVIEISQIGVRGSRNDLSDVAGIRVGHHHRIGEGWLTGTTVVTAPNGCVGGVDVRGGGSSTRETDLLAPTTLVDVVHALCLSGPSSCGLAAADGVMERLESFGIGLRVGEDERMVVPIVPAACLFDLRGVEEFTNRPDASFGCAAFDDASTQIVKQDNVGAGAERGPEV
jgi:L-aminopeptidase/D-esterase-like protein